CWGSLTLANLGSVLIWVSIFSGSAKGMIYGIGFVLYALALIHPLKELTEITRNGLNKLNASV
ncbi:MAG: hypothetical protein ACKOGC_07885, partial [Anaerolineae bacterium]